jgi:hypothetical protein
MKNVAFDDTTLKCHNALQNPSTVHSQKQLHCRRNPELFMPNVDVILPKSRHFEVMTQLDVTTLY